MIGDSADRRARPARLPRRGRTANRSGARRAASTTARPAGRATGPFGAPEDTLARGLAHLAEHRRDLPAGTLRLRPLRLPLDAAARRLAAGARAALGDRAGRDPGPVWEQSFPDVGGIVDPVRDGRRSCGCRRPRSSERREANEERRRNRCCTDLRALDLDPVLVSSHEPRDVVLVLPDVGGSAAVHARAGVRRLLAGAAALVLLPAGCGGGEEVSGPAARSGRRDEPVSDADRSPLRRAGGRAARRRRRPRPPRSRPRGPAGRVPAVPDRPRRLAIARGLRRGSRA